MKEAIMAKQYEILDRHGRLVEGDIIPDGGRLRVSMMMKDSMSPVQRAVAEDSEARRFPVVDAFGRPAGRRPGACYARPAPEDSPERAAQITREFMRQEAYQDSVKEMCDAWRKPVKDLSGESRNAHPGDVCTVRGPEYPFDQGAPGHLDARLVCVPDKPRRDSVPRTMDAADAQRIRDEAYAEFVRSHEWKAP